MPHCADEKSKDQRQRAIPQATQQSEPAGFLRKLGPSSLKPSKTLSRGLKQRLLGECVNENSSAKGSCDGHNTLPVYMLYVLFPSGDNSININKYLFMLILCQALCLLNCLAITIQNGQHFSHFTEKKTYLESQLPELRTSRRKDEFTERTLGMERVEH